MRQAFFPIWDGKLVHIGVNELDSAGWSTACGIPYPTNLGRNQESTVPTCLACIVWASAHATFTP